MAESKGNQLLSPDDRRRIQDKLAQDGRSVNIRPDGLMVDVGRPTIPPVVVEKKAPSRTQKVLGAIHDLRSGPSFIESVSPEHIERAVSVTTAGRVVEAIQKLGAMLGARSVRTRAEGGRYSVYERNLGGGRFERGVDVEGGVVESYSEF